MSLTIKAATSETVGKLFIFPSEFLSAISFNLRFVTPPCLNLLLSILKDFTCTLLSSNIFDNFITTSESTLLSIT
ncbi:hypothetical protein Lalb_Chr01g0013451 [Lupinus albus]|uniref:Uncharacterized protein n=1 Tax=Lupinus albus TaxID=3870 RepID=A0A6A4R3A9_LUPAL|nr:hypothetical protein Lalb_Chr01g0013451 [Lupinus albus]